jgi:VIT1/CCC1 family predicted Fe2+/Mn2+ transporter
LPATPHVEHHFMGSESVRDVVIRMADGLTVPFALAAGLTAAVTSSHLMSSSPPDWRKSRRNCNGPRWLSGRPVGPCRAPISALTIAISYVVGGLIPLTPYILGFELRQALIFSVAVTGVALVIFGAVKGRINMVKSALQTVLVGGLAAGAAFYLASLFGG